MIRAHGNKISTESLKLFRWTTLHGRTLARSRAGQPKYPERFRIISTGCKVRPAEGVTALEQVVSERTAGIFSNNSGRGWRVPDEHEFMQKSREICDRYDALLVDDEVQCGVGRAGKYFSYQLLDPI